jgi:uncharacterized protein
MDIKHDESGKRFSTALDGDEAYVSYAQEGDVIDLQHTIVPAAHENKGIGSALVKHALDHARAKNLKVRPTCPFVSAYIEKNADYADLEES